MPARRLGAATGWRRSEHHVRLPDLWRLLRGPSLMDRVLAVDTMVINIIARVFFRERVSG